MTLLLMLVLAADAPPPTPSVSTSGDYLKYAGGKWTSATIPDCTGNTGALQSSSGTFSCGTISVSTLNTYCAAGQYANAFDGGSVSCAQVTGGQISGAVATATALASNPADCSAGQYATTIAANGDLTCATVTGSQVSGAVATATALAATPISCDAGQFATTIAASGNLGCSAVPTSTLSGTITNAQLASSYSGVGACGANTWASTLNANAAPSCTQPAFSNISGTVTNSQLASSYSGVGTCSSSQWARVLNANAAPTCSQPAFSDLSGTATNAQLASSYSGVGACGANTFASTLNTNAAPTCTQPAFSNLTGTATVTQGGTGAAPAGDDQVFVSSSASAGAWQTIPNCTDTTGNHLNYTQSTNAFSCGTSKPTIDQMLFDVSTGLGAGTLLATGTVYGGMKLINAATVSHVSLYVSVGSSTTAANQVLTITDGTNTCTATFACNTVTNTTGVKDVATANGSGTGCVYAANALVTFSTTTQGCVTAATVKNINIVGHY